MNRLLLVAVSVSALAAFAAAADTLPDKFYGKFSLDHSENFDEYLTAMGYGWFTRKLIVFATFEKVFKKGENGKFDYDNLTSKKDVHYKDVALGTEFTGEGLDSKDHKVTFYLKDGKLYEKHVPVDKSGEAKDELYEYYFDNEFLVVRMGAPNGVVGKRFYKRVTA